MNFQESRFDQKDLSGTHMWMQWQSTSWPSEEMFFFGTVRMDEPPNPSGVPVPFTYINMYIYIYLAELYGRSR